jgi:hypothetical protein
LWIGAVPQICNPQSRIRPREIDMTTFSNDVDILKCEPGLFGELHWPSQVRAMGTGATLENTTLTAGGIDFMAAQVKAGGVIYLRSADGSLEGAYEIVSVDSSTQLTVSVVRADAADPVIAPPPACDVSYRASTFEPQAIDAALQLTEYFGIRPGDPSSEIGVEDLLDTEGLRRASVLRIISTIYEAWSGQTDGAPFQRKSQLYQQLFEKARQRCHLTIDLGADGVADVARVGGAIRLVRD